jgi:ferredoxin-NADP reductase
VFLCGHPGMIANARAIMRRAGLDDKEIREEQYWPE